MVGRIVRIHCLEGVLRCQMAAAGYGQLEAVNMKTLFIGVCQESDKVVFLNTG